MKLIFYAPIIRIRHGWKMDNLPGSVTASLKSFTCTVSKQLLEIRKKLI